MKKLLLLTALFAASARLWGLGWLNFDTLVPWTGVDAPVFDTDGKTLLAGPSFVAQLYAGLNDTTLEPVGIPIAFETGPLAGYIRAKEMPLVGAVTGVYASVQMRAWRAADGASYEAAVATRGHFGSSKIIRILVGCADCGVPIPPDTLVGLNSFALSDGPQRARLGLAAVAENATSLRLRAQPATRWELVSSTNLVDWRKEQTLTVDGTGDVKVPLRLLGSGPKFYRAVLAP
jgi:hypothetical protein